MKDIQRIWLRTLALFTIIQHDTVGFSLIQSPTTSKTELHASSVVSEDKCDVAIFGGGFGGLYTALALSREARKAPKSMKALDIALVDPSDRFVFLPFLYDLVMGTASESEVCPTFEELLEDTGIRHIQASFDNFEEASSTASILKNGDSSTKLSFQSAVVAVGATPQSTLSSIPGAAELTQPFYTKNDARATRLLLDKLERRMQSSSRRPRIGVVGGGYGGVELSACIKRRLPDTDVTLLTRGAPMQGTKAEPLVEQALSRLGVNVELSGVESVQKVEQEGSMIPNDMVYLERTQMDTAKTPVDDSTPWDAVLWTAGSGPAYPVCESILGLDQIEGSGRLVVDTTLRCVYANATSLPNKPHIWSLGDCSQIVDPLDSFAVPKTAQAAIQQADVVALNVLSDILGKKEFKSFEYQDLGTMLSLGGPNAAVMAPREESTFGPLFSTLLDTTRIGLGLADEVLSQVSKSPIGEKAGLGPLVENLNLSLGGYGLGVDTNSSPGTLSGTLSGAARRAIYSIRMPTNKQRAKSAVFGALSSATALSKEIADQIQRDTDASNSR